MNVQSYEIFYEVLYENNLIPDPTERLTATYAIDGITYDINTDYSKILELYGEEYARYARQVKVAIDQDEDSRLAALFSHNIFLLESHVFYAYLQNAINNEKDPDIRGYLMASKYDYIATVRCVGETFANDYDIDAQISYYANQVYKMISKYPNFREMYEERSKVQLKTLQDELLGRKKEKYESLDEQINDMMTNIFTKTVISTAIDEETRKKFIADMKTGESMVESPLEKNNFKQSIKIKKKYTLTENIQKHINS